MAAILLLASGNQSTRTQTGHANDSERITTTPSTRVTRLSQSEQRIAAAQSTRTQPGHTNDSARMTTTQSIRVTRSSQSRTSTVAEDAVVLQNRNRSSRTPRGRTVDSASNTNEGNNDPPPPYQDKALTPGQANVQSERQAPLHSQPRTAPQQPIPRTTYASPVDWSLIAEHPQNYSVKAPHWSHSLYASKRYEAKRNKFSHIDLGYGSSIATPEYYFSCHLANTTTSLFSIEHNLQRIVMLYLRHRKRYDCDCSLARLCLDLQPKHVQVHASTPQLDDAGYQHFLRSKCSSAMTGCDFFERQRSWRDRRLARKLTKALQKHSRQCLCQCFGAWATSQKDKQANAVPLKQNRDLITLHRSASEEGRGNGMMLVGELSRVKGGLLRRTRLVKNGKRISGDAFVACWAGRKLRKNAEAASSTGLFRYDFAD